MQIALKIDLNKITLDDLIALDEADKLPPREMKALIIRLLDENDTETKNQVGQIPIMQLQAALVEGVKKARENTVPPGSGCK